MSGFGPTGGGRNPFENIFGDLARLLGAAGGPLNWDVARQVGALIAAEGQSEPNVDPIERLKLEELVRVAELHVSQAIELPAVRSVTTLSHVDWTARTLEDWRPILEKLAESLSHVDDEDFDELSDGPGELGAMADMQKWMGPVLLGMQAGGMVGHLAKRSLGYYDLPIPRPRIDGVTFVPANITSFADEWSLPMDELNLYVAIEECVRVAVMSRPHVSQRFLELLTEYTAGFQPSATAIEERLGLLDMDSPDDLPAALIDPQALLGAIQTSAQRETLARLSALLAAFVGYVDWTVSRIAATTIASASAIAEAVKRRRVEESDGYRLVEQLLGLEMSQATFDRGNAFVYGVIERAGESGLARIWNSAHELPTPAEIAAPGLWLERIDLPASD